MVGIKTVRRGEEAMLNLAKCVIETGLLIVSFQWNKVGLAHLAAEIDHLDRPTAETFGAVVKHRFRSTFGLW